MFAGFGFAQSYFAGLLGSSSSSIQDELAYAAQIYVRAEGWEIVIPADPTIVPLRDPVVQVEN